MKKDKLGAFFSAICIYLHLQTAHLSSPTEVGAMPPAQDWSSRDPAARAPRGTPAGLRDFSASSAVLLSFFTPSRQSTRQMIYVHGSDLFLLPVPRPRRGRCPVPWDAAGWQRGRSGPSLTCRSEAWHVHAGLCRAGISDFILPEASPETCLKFSCSR